MNLKVVKKTVKIGKPVCKFLDTLADPETKQLPIMIDTSVGNDDEIEVSFIFSNDDISRLGGMSTEEWKTSLEG